MAEERVQRRLSAILAADVVGYSRLMEADEEGTRARLRSLQAALIDPQIAADGGRIVKTMGDGILAEFPSAVGAVRCALAIQQALGQRNASLPEASRMAFRVGINVGDVIVEGDDIHGDGVNVAARLEGICEPGAVYVSGAVHDQAVGKLAAAFEDLGEQTVKNIARPLRVYRASEPAAVEARPQTPATLSGAARPSGSLPLPAKPSIAVLPFDNMSGDPEQEFFADGIVEDIITTLSKVPLLFVVSRNSTFVYKGKAVDIKQVAAEQGVRYVLEGSVRRAGDRVRITAQLIDASDGRHIWADRYDGRLDDVFGLQDTITQAIVGAMEVRLTEGEQARVWRNRAGDPLVYEHMLRGRAFYEQFTRRTHLQARQEFESAARLNPDYATSYVYIAYTHADAARWGWSEEPARSIEATFSCIDRALAVDPDEPDAIACRSYTHMLNKDYDTALADIRRAIELAPSRAEIHHVAAMVYNYSGLPADGKDVASQAVRLSPMAYGHILTELAHSYCLLRQYDDAIAILRGVLAERPFWRSARALLVYALWESGAADAAKSEAAALLGGSGRFSLTSWAKCHPYRDPDDLDRYMHALGSAGIRE